MKIGKKLLSYLMVIILLINTIIAVNICTTQAARKNGQELKAYKKLLQKGSTTLKISGASEYLDFSGMRFVVKDLNHDGVSELVIDTMRGSLNAVVLSYYNGKIKVVNGCYHSFPQYYKKGSIFSVNGVTTGITFLTSYQIIDGKGKKVAEMTNDEARYDGKGKKYYVGGKEVGKAEYTSYIKKMTKSTSSSLQDLEYYDITDKNINKYIK